MSCSMAHWPSVVLMLLPTQYFVLQRGNLGISELSILIGTSQVNLSKLLFCMMPHKSATLETLKILSMHGFWMGKGLFWQDCNLILESVGFILLSSFSCLRIWMKSQYWVRGETHTIKCEIWVYLGVQRYKQWNVCWDKILFPML